MFHRFAVWLMMPVLIACGGCCSLFPLMDAQQSSAGPQTFRAAPDRANLPLPDDALQARFEAIDARLRAKHGIAADQCSAGLFDLYSGRLALVRADQVDYAASVPKIAILLAWFHLRDPRATDLDDRTRRDLGLMIKRSDNEIAARFSQELGLEPIQEVLRHYGLYETIGGGIWLGKHYGVGVPRIPDPVSGHSHAATVRQLVRFYWMLDRERLVSREASEAMKDIFASPEIAHLPDRFVKGLEGRGVQVLRKSGWWENWLHDSAIIFGPARRYVLAAMTRHEKGDAYLEDLAREADEVLAAKWNTKGTTNVEGQ